MRLRIVESPDFRAVRESHTVATFPLGDLLRVARRPLLVGIFIQAGTNIPFYIVSVFVLSYGPSAVGVSRNLILSLGTVPLVAMLADRIGRRRVLLFGAVYMAAIAFPFFWLLDTGQPWAILLAMALIVTIGHAVTYSAVAGFLAEMFDARLRYTGVSTAYQVGGMITSGPAPFVAAALFAAFASSWPISAYIVASCVVTFLALLAAPAPAR